jgi:hypothetical protein
MKQKDTLLTPRQNKLMSQFTISRTVEEYVAMAMLLGYTYSEPHHLYVDNEHGRPNLDPDTMEPMPEYHRGYITRCDQVQIMRKETTHANK